MSKNGGKPATGSATGNPRNKTALAPGHSLMDWIRLGASGVDLTGVGGVSQVVDIKQLSKHNQKNDAWIAIRGVVFNVTRYMDFHPGGVDELMKGVGKDATKMFEEVHAWVNYQSILQKCIVGRLSRALPTELSLSPLLPPLPSPPKRDSSTTEDNPGKLRENSETETAVNDKTIKIEFSWQQTSNNISFTFKMSGDNKMVPFFELNHQNNKEFDFQMFLLDSVRVFEFELADSVNWPPSFSENPEKKELKLNFRKEEAKVWPSFGNKTESSKKRTLQNSEQGKVFHTWKIVESKQICEDVFHIILKRNGFMQILPVGWHVKVKVRLLDTNICRDYTPIPLSFSSELENSNSKNEILNKVTEDCLCLAVKCYENGAVSPSITRLKTGDDLEVSSCLGSFVFQNYEEYLEIHMIAGGTGLTPMLSVIQKALSNRNILKINLLNFNRRKSNIFYGNQLEAINKNNNRFLITNILSQAEDDWKGHKGLISKDLLKELVGFGNKNGCVFICGPPKFMQSALELLKQLSWRPEQLHSFSG